MQITLEVPEDIAANLAGKEAPKHEENETTMEDLRGRIAKCIGFLDTLKEGDFAQTKPDTVIKLAFPKGKAALAQEYLIGRQLPNFFFHVTTAYALLRAGGVELGKGDFIGQINLLDQ